MTYKQQLISYLVLPAAMEQATAELDRMAVDGDAPAVSAQQADGGGGAAAVNGPSSSAQPPDRPPSAAPSAPASGAVL